MALVPFRARPNPKSLFALRNETETLATQANLLVPRSPKHIPPATQATLSLYDQMTDLLYRLISNLFHLFSIFKNGIIYKLQYYGL